MILKSITQLAIWAIMLLPSSVSNATIEHNHTAFYTQKLPEVVIKAPKIIRHAKVQLDGYKTASGVNTRINSTLKDALQEYNGPRPLINSLRRNWNSHSPHTYGKAVDFQWSPEMIEYLVSEEGLKWLDKFQVTFYIEGKPGSSKVAAYKGKEPYKKYIFENPSATGDHIHLNI